MIIRKTDDRESGIFFAVWPRRTPEGLVMLEWLHWKRVEGWGWGSGDTFAYDRYVPDKLYDQGKRAAFNPHPGAQAAAVRPTFCKGPEKCAYPLCQWTDGHGFKSCGYVHPLDVDAEVGR